MCYLRDHDVAVWCSAILDEAVQDVLRNLRSFATACCSSDDHHWVVVNGRHDLLFKTFDRQLVTIAQDLDNSKEPSVKAAVCFILSVAIKRFLLVTPASCSAECDEVWKWGRAIFLSQALSFFFPKLWKCARLDPRS